MQAVTLLTGETHANGARLPTWSNSRSTSGLPIIACCPSPTRPGIPFPNARHPPTVGGKFDKRCASLSARPCSRCRPKYIPPAVQPLSALPRESPTRNNLRCEVETSGVGM
ncbi:unnamed protein product [Chondrus crispus]|uniref:Uncharacterized protein n=1 Tax=Chondrus crispus TaxID=2769 RepID=R7QGS0_CHOCR|nr:unnamed protein product [Chondrus crispus]CDF36610.1 unnamed protein product [Chondrus crispus]|eukprot:XP_005716429.1 unnamed protein product [Chondrus crispus]